MFKQKHTRFNLRILIFIVPLTFLGMVISVLNAPKAYAAPPRCYDYRGETIVACDRTATTDTGGLRNDRCYRESGRNPRGDLLGYNEVSCDNTGGSILNTNRERIITRDTCGGANQAVKISINIGCLAKGNPIVDAVFAIIRILSIGVGLVIIASTIVAGIQYTASRGDPGAVAKALERVQNNVIALLLFIFAFALLNWLVPAGLLR